jgi:hypothetical protein
VNVIFVRLICVFKSSNTTIDIGRKIQKYSFFVENVPDFWILYSTLHCVHGSNNCNNCNLKFFYSFHKILKYKFITICLIEQKKKLTNLDLPLQAPSRRSIRCISHIYIDLGYSLMFNINLHKISITFKPALKGTSI